MLSPEYPYSDCASRLSWQHEELRSRILVTDRMVSGGIATNRQLVIRRQALKENNSDNLNLNKCLIYFIFIFGASFNTKSVEEKDSSGS